MNSKQQKSGSVTAPPEGAESSERDYRRLLAFLKLASGFNLAIARCNVPSKRQKLIQRATEDASSNGIRVLKIDIAKTFNGDLISAVKSQCPAMEDKTRWALMITGIDDLIYKSKNAEKTAEMSRPPFVAQLNYDRERIAGELPFPFVLWLETEAWSLLLREAPDLSRWVSARFDFGVRKSDEPFIERLVDKRDYVLGRPPEETGLELADVKGLLDELKLQKSANDPQIRSRKLGLLLALADRYVWTSRPAEALSPLHEAMELAMELHDHRAEANALGNLGNAYADLGETRNAIEFYEKALAIDREIGDRRGEGNALRNLGNAYYQLGETRKAIEFYEKALAIDREIGDRRGEGNDLGNLGIAYADLGETRKAIEFYEQALAIELEIGDRRGEGNGFGNLGNAYAALGETRKAIEFYEQHLVIAREIGDRRGEGNALGNLGSAYADLGETRKAIEFYEQHLVIARKIGDRHGEASSLFNASLAFHELGDTQKAIAWARDALRIYTEIESPHAEKTRRQLREWGSTNL